jgi:hypothetical protein
MVPFVEGLLVEAKKKMVTTMSRSRISIAINDTIEHTPKRVHPFPLGVVYSQ